MRYVKCNLCDSDDYVLVDSHRKDKYCKPEVEVRTVICKTCGLVYVNPQPEDIELHDLYSTTYAGTRVNLPDEKRLLRKEIGAKSLIRWLDQRVDITDRPGKILDIGCAEGSFLHAFSKRGWDAYGVEPTPHYAESARERYHLKVIAGFLEDADLPNSYFDIVTLIQTFEHLADPTQALTIIRDLLENGGIIYINVPNILKPKHFRCFEAPHLYTYSPNTLRLFLQKTGFEPMEIENGWNIQALARKSSPGSVDFPSEGDDYTRIIGSLKWRYIRLIPQLVQKWLTVSISFTIRRIFGESTGQKILDFIKRLLRRKLK